MKAKKKVYDRRHGGPFDRGSADAYYQRPKSPHYFLGNTYSTPRVGEEKMTPAQVEAYHAGYDQQDEFKEW